jgi:hypothetical protein
MMDDKDQFQSPRQPQPENQPYVSPVAPRDTTQSSATFVPDEYEPATERTQFAAPIASPPAFSRPDPLTPPSPPNEPQLAGQAGLSPDQPQKKSKKRLIIGVVIAALLLLLVGGAAAAYKFWYQNPQKVVSDAVMNVLKAKTLTYRGNLSVEYEGGKVVIDMDGAHPNLTSGATNLRATISTDDAEYKVDGSGMVDRDGVLYVKLSNVREIIDSMAEQYGVQTQAFDEFVNKVDGKWIKISEEDIKKIDEEAGATQECVSTALNKFNDDDAAKRELADVYEKNPFVNIADNLGSQTIDGTDSMGYTITVDDRKADAFADSIKDLQVAKDLQKCDDSISMEPDESEDSDEDSETTVQVWVSRWSHELKRLKIEGASDDNSGSFTFDPLFNNEVSIDTPEDALTITELQDEISKAFGAYPQEVESGAYMKEAAPAPQT